MSAPIRIAFAGLMRAGKDTAADHVLHNHDGMAMKIADPLYDIMRYAQTVAGVPQEKDRKFLQWVGTEWGRAQNENVWVGALIRKIRERATPKAICISDARFTNEFDALKKEGFIIVKITRPESARMAAEAVYVPSNLDKFKRFFGIKPKFAVHASERDVLTYQGFDFEISNDGTISEFYARIDIVLGIAYGPVV